MTHSIPGWHPPAEKHRHEVDIRRDAAMLFIAAYGGEAFDMFLRQCDSREDVRMTRLVRWMEYGDR